MESNGVSSEQQVRSRRGLQLSFPGFSQAYSHPTQTNDASDQNFNRPLSSRDSSPSPLQVLSQPSQQIDTILNLQNFSRPNQSRDSSPSSLHGSCRSAQPKDANVYSQSFSRLPQSRDSSPSPLQVSSRSAQPKDGNLHLQSFSRPLQSRDSSPSPVQWIGRAVQPKNSSFLSQNFFSRPVQSRDSSPSPGQMLGRPAQSKDPFAFLQNLSRQLPSRDSSPSSMQMLGRPVPPKDSPLFLQNVTSQQVPSRDSSPSPMQVLGRPVPPKDSPLFLQNGTSRQVSSRDSSPLPMQLLGRPVPPRDSSLFLQSLAPRSLHPRDSSPSPMQALGRPGHSGDAPTPPVLQNLTRPIPSRDSSPGSMHSLPQSTQSQNLMDSSSDQSLSQSNSPQHPSFDFVHRSSRNRVPVSFATSSVKTTSVLARQGHPTQIERLRSQGLASCGKLKITPNKMYDFTSDDLIDQGEIGHGNYGTVNKMFHELSGTVMAVKRIRSTIDEKDQKQLLMDLDVVMRSDECPYIVKFYGALFKEGDCWICMELMSISLDQFYRYIHGSLRQRIREDVLARITLATLHALNYLKESLKIIHRDVKPSNILLDTSGNIKMCDFGISGHLVDSVAKTRDAGCRPYMAPERIDPKNFSQGYDVRSDVWSLGITLFEVSTGQFPYRKWHSIFDQLTQVVQGDPPHLDSAVDHFSPELADFVNTCLIKNYEARPKYTVLLKHDFVRRSMSAEVDVSGYVTRILNQMANQRMTSSALCQ